MLGSKGSTLASTQTWSVIMETRLWEAGVNTFCRSLVNVVWRDLKLTLDVAVAAAAGVVLAESAKDADMAVGSQGSVYKF